MIKSQTAENSRGCERVLQAADLCIICALSTARSRSSPGVCLGPLASDPCPRNFMLTSYALFWASGRGFRALFISVTITMAITAEP